MCRELSDRRSMFLLFAAVAICTTLEIDTAGAAEREGVAAAANSPQPVDDSMHHFMEYVYEPGYKRLKAALADPPADKKAWKSIKGDALTLAECANLLMARSPDEGAVDWRSHSVVVREQGGALYQAARAGDYAAAQKAWGAMLRNCNRCHKQFADGEHQLTP